MTFVQMDATTAEHVAVVAAVNATRRAENEHPDDWGSCDSWRRFVGVVRTVRAWQVNSHTVYAGVTDSEDGRIWSYVASEALDRVPLAEMICDSAVIEQVSPVGYHLVWKSPTIDQLLSDKQCGVTGCTARIRHFNRFCELCGLANLYDTVVASGSTGDKPTTPALARASVYPGPEMARRVEAHRAALDWPTPYRIGH